MLTDLEILWQSSGFLARASLCVAGATAAAHVMALAGAPFTGPLAAFFVLHIAVMVLGFVLVARLVFGRRAVASPPRAREPQRLRWVAVLLGVNFLAWFFGTFMYYGEGGAEARGGRYVWIRAGEVVRTITSAEYDAFAVNIARVFSGGWLFAAFVLALLHGHLDMQRARQSTLSQHAA